MQEIQKTPLSKFLVFTAKIPQIKSKLKNVQISKNGPKIIITISVLSLNWNNCFLLPKTN